jgi:hypothetical protein
VRHSSNVSAWQQNNAHTLLRTHLDRLQGILVMLARATIHALLRCTLAAAVRCRPTRPLLRSAAASVLGAAAAQLMACVECRQGCRLLTQLVLLTRCTASGVVAASSASAATVCASCWRL